MSERTAAKAARLAELAARNEGSDVGRLALEVADLVNVTAYEEPGGPGRVDRLEAEVDARFTVHELAITELYRRIGPDRPVEPDATLFKIPVAYAEGQDAESIRAAVEVMKAGLSGDEVVDRLERDGLVRRVRGPLANDTDVTVTPPRQGVAGAEEARR